MNRKFKRTVLISNETLLEQCKRLYCCFFSQINSVHKTDIFPYKICTENDFCNAVFEQRNISYLVHIMEDSLMSSDQMRAVQSATVRKFLGKNGFLCRA